MKTSSFTHRSLILMFLVPTFSLPTPYPSPQAVAPNVNNTFTVSGSSSPLTVQVFFDGNTPGTSPPALSHPAIYDTLSSLVKTLSAHAFTSPLLRSEQASVNGTMARIRPETAHSKMDYSDAVRVTTALQEFLEGKNVDEEIDFVVEGALQGEDGQAKETVVANGFVRHVVAKGNEEGRMQK